MEKVLVTGGAGFIGSHTVDHLIKENYDVAVADDLSHGFQENVNPDAVFYKADVCNAEELKAVFQREKPSYVIHEAAQIDVRKSINEPVYDARINILGSLNVVDLCREFNVERIVYASTGGAIYGEPEYLPADEKHPQKPLSPYGASKLAVENYLSMYRRLHGLDYISLRYSNVYGPRQDPLGEAGVVAIFTAKMLKGEKPIINGDGEQTRDFVYVGDVAEANLFSLKKQTVKSVFNIGSGVESSVNDIYNRLREITGSGIKAVHGEAIKGEVGKIYLDCRLAGKELGWRPTTELVDGLGKTVDWFRKQ